MKNDDPARIPKELHPNEVWRDNAENGDIVWKGNGQSGEVC